MFHVSPLRTCVPNVITEPLPPFLAKLAVCLQIHWIYNDERIGDTKEKWHAVIRPSVPQVSMVIGGRITGSPKCRLFKEMRVMT